MKTTTNTRREVAAAMVSLLCASLFVLSLSGCAEENEYYADAYHTPEYWTTFHLAASQLNMLSIGGEMSINVGHRHEPQNSAEQP